MSVLNRVWVHIAAWGTSLVPHFIQEAWGPERFKDVPRPHSWSGLGRKECQCSAQVARGPHHSRCFVQKQREDLACLGRAVWLRKLLLSQQSLLLRVAGPEPPCPGPVLFLGTVHTQ